LEECDGLDTCNFEALSAADVFAGNHIVATHHVGLSFGKAGAVALVGVTGQSILFVADEPTELVVRCLAAMGTGEGVVALLGTFIKKFPFFHLFSLQS
jgi:hypothetical protein